MELERRITEIRTALEAKKVDLNAVIAHSVETAQPLIDDPARRGEGITLRRQADLDRHLVDEQALEQYFASEEARRSTQISLVASVAGYRAAFVAGDPALHAGVHQGALGEPAPSGAGRPARSRRRARPSTRRSCRTRP